MRANSGPAASGSFGPALARAGLAILAVLAFVALLATRPAPGTPDYRAAGNALHAGNAHAGNLHAGNLHAGNVLDAGNASVLARMTPAEPPFVLRTEITDHANALRGDTAQVKASFDKLRSDSGVQMFVAYVDSFDGMRAQDWAHRTADMSNLGDNDVLLAVATGDRAYAYSVSGRFPLSDDQLASIANDHIEPALAKNDWSGAAIAAADGIGAGINGTSASGGSSTSGGSGAGSVVLWLLVLAAIVVVVILLVRYARRRSAAAHGAQARGGSAAGAEPAEPDDLAGLSTDELGTRANAMLVGTDDAIRASQEETGFAEAQFGAEATAPFRAAVEQARSELTAAFGVRQKLDDAEGSGDGEPAEAARRQAYVTIIDHCTRANALLDDQSAAFERLRDLETTLPEVLPTLTNRHAELVGKVPAAQAELARLTQTYAPSALVQVDANIDQADERLRFADENLALARQNLEADKRGEAVVAARTAEEALGQAETLLGAVGSLGQDLAEASGRISAMRAEITGEIAEARASGSDERAAELSAAIAKAEAALAATSDPVDPTSNGSGAGAAATATATAGDPLADLRRLEEADEALDAALANVRDDQDRARKATQLLEQALLSARSQISAAQDFVATRRGAVGGDARTRLAEAARAYDQAVALSSTDPSQALEYARHADQLAREATSLAQSDIADWQARSDSGVGAGAMGGGGAGGGAMSGMAGAMLGGILSNVLLGGGGGRRSVGGFGGFGGMGGMGGAAGGSSGGGRRGGGGRF